ncbi:uncharacterized protein LOC142765652 [Rhipicephalus microplus]|uniref:uncharacterized protein LOC142765652 n=1 Tax=Rhipicephalus microplus TaxID=6941 RepID=UPI003F6C4031
MASSTSTSSQSKLIGLAAVIFTLLVTAQGQQPNNAGGSLPNVGPMGTGLNPPFQVPPGQPIAPQQAPPAAAGFDRRVPFPRAGLEAALAPQGPGGPMGPHIPPELMARHVAFLKAAAARARAMQEAAADGEDTPQPSPFRERGQPRPAIDGARPVDFPKAIPPFHRPQGIPTRQGGNVVNNGDPASLRARAKREHRLNDAAHRRNAHTV